MKVDTTNYQETHGVAPRGIGEWRFYARRDGAWTDLEARGEQKYTDARRQAVAEASRLGCDLVVVAE